MKIRHKFKIATLGCKVNQCDSKALKKELEKFDFVGDELNPDVLVLNTCAVTKTAMKKGKRKLNELHKKYPQAKHVLMGCWPEVYQREIAGLRFDLRWGTGKLDNLAAEIKSMLANCQKERGRDGNVVVSDINTNVLMSQKASPFGINPPGEGERSRYFLKIQDGCEQFCSYCIIPYCRGKLRSRPKKEVIDEITQAIKVGFREIVLCGIHLGLYGKEKNSKTCNLTELLSEIITVPSLGRVRMSSIEINNITDNLLGLMKKNDKICDHLHIPLQSGSNKILLGMNRPYNTGYFKTKILKIRKMMPNIAITTDVIVGFPGETEKEFNETKTFIGKMGFSKLHVFPFSAHEKTPAAKMNRQVLQNDLLKRSQVLRAISKRLMEKYKMKFAEKKINLVVENISGERIAGKEEHYFNVQIARSDVEKTASIQIGNIVSTKQSQ